MIELCEKERAELERRAVTVMLPFQEVQESAREVIAGAAFSDRPGVGS